MAGSSLAVQWLGPGVFTATKKKKNPPVVSCLNQNSPYTIATMAITLGNINVSNQP